MFRTIRIEMKVRKNLNYRIIFALIIYENSLMEIYSERLKTSKNFELLLLVNNITSFN